MTGDLREDAEGRNRPVYDASVFTVTSKGLQDGICYRAEVNFPFDVDDEGRMAGGNSDIDVMLIQKHGDRRFDVEALNHARRHIARLTGRGSFFEVPAAEAQPLADAIAAAWRECLK